MRPLPPGIEIPGYRRSPLPGAQSRMGRLLVARDFNPGRELDGIGFDPYIGFLHRLDYGRPSLALDLLEEFRPALVDRLTTRLLNLGILRREDFSRGPDSGLYLGREGKRRYFAEYEKELNTPVVSEPQSLTFRDAFRRQADRLAAALTRDEPYESFLLPC
jgi:CRISPR-associated protein Cas1